MDIDALQPLLDDLRARHGIVGASAAVLAGGEVTAAATGVLSLRTGVPVTTDSAFQIGSVTKVYTTTLLMQLVDEGRLELDALVGEVLPGVRFGPPGITVAQLLCHTSGVYGDWFGPFPTDPWGRGDDAIEATTTPLPPLPDPPPAAPAPTPAPVIDTPPLPAVPVADYVAPPLPPVSVAVPEVPSAVPAPTRVAVVSTGPLPFRYPVVFVLPLALLALGGAMSRTLTQPVAVTAGRRR